MADQVRPARVAVIQGPLHALAAAAAVLHLQQKGEAAENVLVIGDLNVEHHDELLEASIACAAGVEWADVIDGRGLRDAGSLRDAMGDRDVRDVLCVRNWQTVNELALTAFPQARRIVLGDGLGLIDADRNPARPQFDLALPIIAQPKSPDSLDGLPVEVVPRRNLEAAMSAARARIPGLPEKDAELARFVRGGVVVLLSWLAETMTASLRAEIDQADALVRRATAGVPCPVVIKPHPRASLGQAAALARRLRAAGYRTAIMTGDDYGHYPIEMFGQLVHAAGRIIAPGSSSALSLMYVHGVRSTVQLPRGLAVRTLTPRHWRVYQSAGAHMDGALDLLGEWDEDSTLPPWPPFRPTRWQQVLDRIVRPITWRRTSGLSHRDAQPFPKLLPRVLRRRLGVRDEDALRTLARPDLGLLWATRRDSGFDPGSSGAPTESIDSVARALAATRSGTLAVLLAAVLPSSHAPGWQLALLRKRGVPVLEGANWRAEEIEELLEAHVDVIVRVPEPSARKRADRRRGHGAANRGGIPPGCVAFVCRSREGNR